MMIEIFYFRWLVGSSYYRIGRYKKTLAIRSRYVYILLLLLYNEFDHVILYLIVLLLWTLM